jgi:hypothetical protein
MRDSGSRNGLHIISGWRRFLSRLFRDERPDTVLSVAAMPACRSGLLARAVASEEKRVADLYVCGLDLSTGRVVQADQREVWEWRPKGHNGDGTLVCHHGTGSPDGAPVVVPLVPRGRIGGTRRRHFAHPPGVAPAGGHSPETAWRWEVKHRLCRWVQAAGADARVEA